MAQPGYPPRLANNALNKRPSPERVTCRGPAASGARCWSASRFTSCARDPVGVGIKPTTAGGGFSSQGTWLPPPPQQVVSNPALVSSGDVAQEGPHAAVAGGVAQVLGELVVMQRGRVLWRTHPLRSPTCSPRNTPHCWAGIAHDDVRTRSVDRAHSDDRMASGTRSSGPHRPRQDPMGHALEART